MLSKCCNDVMYDGAQCLTCGADGREEIWASQETKLILHGMADQVPLIIGNSQKKIEFLQLLDHVRTIIISL